MERSPATIGPQRGAAAATVGGRHIEALTLELVVVQRKFLQGH